MRTPEKTSPHQGVWAQHELGSAPVYLDYAATCPMDPRVSEKMAPCFGQVFGNAGSSHYYGRMAAEAVEWARDEVGRALGARSDRVIWTSGATEADNLAVKGIAETMRSQHGRDHVVTIATEHKAVLDCLDCLEDDGFSSTVVPVQSNGLPDIAALRRAITPSTALVSVMAANNETGVLAPLAEVGRICREAGVVFHTDGVQAFGKIPLDVRELDVDLVSLSSHKIYGPKGIGALWIHPDLEIAPQIHGGGQECGLRSGTLNVPAIVGFGEATRIGRKEMGLEGRRISAIRDRLQRALLARVPGAQVHGASAPRLPGHLSIGLPRVDAKALLAELDDDVAASTVSACSTGCSEPSHVLKAMGVPAALSRGTLRLTVGRFTGPEDVDHVARRIVETLRTSHLR